MDIGSRRRVRTEGSRRFGFGTCSALTRRITQSFKRLLLLDAPPATPLGTGQYLDARHRTVSCTSANTGVCTGPYQPDQLRDRKTVLGGGLLSCCANTSNRVAWTVRS